MFELSHIFEQVVLHIPTFVLAFSFVVLLNEFGLKEKWRNLGAVTIAVLTAFLMNGGTAEIAGKFFTASLAFLLFNQIIKLIKRGADE